MPRLDFHSAAAMIELFRDAAAQLRDSSLRRGCAVRLPRRGRLLVTGDLHDNPEHYRKIVQLATLDASTEHHLVVHELIHGDHLLNGMDFSYRMLANVADLVMRYPDQVHPLLANHELSQLTGRGVTKGAGNSVVLFNDALEYVFGDDVQEVIEALHEFIRAMPLALLTESGALIAHSLPNDLSMRSFDPDVLDRELTNEDRSAPAGSAYLMVWGRAYNEQTVERLGEAWGVRQFFLGHQRIPTGIELVMPRVIVLNSDHDRATVLPLDLTELPSEEQLLMSALPLQAVGVKLTDGE